MFNACLFLWLKVSISECKITISFKLTHTLEICLCLNIYLIGTIQTILFPAQLQINVQKGHLKENIYNVIDLRNKSAPTQRI